jgi:hypothetical protein
VEGAGGHPLNVWELIPDPLIGLLAGLSAVGEDQDLVWFGSTGPDEIAGLGDYDAGLAATGAGQDRVVVFVDNTGQPLTLGEWVVLDCIEEFLIVGQLSFDELPILFFADFMALGEQREKLGNNAFLLSRQDIKSERVVQLADQASVILPPSLNRAVPGIAVPKDRFEILVGGGNSLVGGLDFLEVILADQLIEGRSRFFRFCLFDPGDGEPALVGRLKNDVVPDQTVPDFRL